MRDAPQCFENSFDGGHKHASLAQIDDVLSRIRPSPAERRYTLSVREPLVELVPEQITRGARPEEEHDPPGACRLHRVHQLYGNILTGWRLGRRGRSWPRPCWARRRADDRVSMAGRTRCPRGRLVNALDRDVLEQIPEMIGCTRTRPPETKAAGSPTQAAARDVCRTP